MTSGEAPPLGESKSWGVRALLFVDKFNCKHICKSRGFVALTSGEAPPLGESKSWGVNEPFEFKFSRHVS